MGPGSLFVYNLVNLKPNANLKLALAALGIVCAALLVYKLKAEAKILLQEV